MSAFGFLIVHDLKKIKNYIFEIKKKPWKLIIYILYIAWFGFILSTAFGTDMDVSAITNLTFKQDVFSVALKALVFLLFAFTLYSSSKKFDGMFSMGDVNFLFPSPISSRIILAYSMFKQAMIAGISSVFLLFFFPLLQTIFGTIPLEAMVYSIVGVVILFVFMVPFTNLTFILSTRFGLRDWLQYFLYGILLLIVGAILYGIYIQQDVVQGVFWAFNRPIFPYIPIVGWSAELIGVSVLGFGPLSTLFLILQLGTIVIMTFFTLFLAQDYYEDALPSAEHRSTIRRNKKEGRKVSLSMKEDKPKKVRQVQVREVGQGPWAFLWMQLVTSKRTSGSLLFQWRTLAILMASIALGLLLPERNQDTFFILAGAIAYILFLTSAQVSMDFELKMKYIFILPGQPWKKIFALNLVPLLKIFIYIVCALLPAGILFGVSPFTLLAGLVFPVSMALLNLFSSVVIHILIPSRFDMKAFFPLIRSFTFLLFLVPPAIGGIALGLSTQSISLAFYTIALINSLLSILLLFLSDRLFGRLEVR